MTNNLKGFEPELFHISIRNMIVHVIMSVVLKGLLLTITDLPTTCAVVVFRVKVNRPYGATKFTYGMKNEKHSGRSSKMTPSCKWPIVSHQFCWVIYMLGQ